MDNVTHSLAGLVLAESAVRLRVRATGAAPSPRFRAVAAISSMIAANLPDADLFYTGVGGDRLKYMLHHRGYTHTLIVAIVGALVMWGAAALVLRFRGRASRMPGDVPWLGALLLVSTLSHLALDWTNSYGVHLLWPFNDRWSYGDAVFIAEPWFWAVTIPMLVASSTSRVARVLLSLVLLIGLALVWRVSIASRGAALALTVGAVLSVLAARQLSRDARAMAAVTGWLAVTVVMMLGARLARQATRDAVRAADPAAEILDVVVTPLPANAVCMSVISVERSAATYHVTTARVSAAPWITNASQCGARGGAGPAFRPSPRPSTSRVQWDSEWTAAINELSTLARESCTAVAALRFIRVPAWRAIGDSTVLIGDVRFGGGSGNGFSDVRARRNSTRCPTAVPPWVPPRADLLATPSSLIIE
jgi:inner membrane protein